MKLFIQRLDGEFDISSANSGRSALEIIDESNIDLLITDIVMPNMDGLELIMEVNGNYPNIKTIAMSGERGTYLRAAAAFGASYILKKPFETDELKSVIYKIFN